MEKEQGKKKWFGWAIFVEDERGKIVPVWQAFGGQAVIYGTKKEAEKTKDRICAERISKVEIREL